MFLKIHIFVRPFFLAFLLLLAACTTGQPVEVSSPDPVVPPVSESLLVGAEQTGRYLPGLSGKRVGVVVNPTSRVGDQHLVDTLLSLGVQVVRIFSPEHGFRGMADAGELVRDEKDVRTGLPVISLYGNHKKPSPEDLAGLDLVLFDLQDVGARFYTYLSTLHYVMEACGEDGIPVTILDRPNPNGHFVDGPILDPKFRSFVGMHPIPIVHGMTLGELGQMINGEGWLKGGIRCDLAVIPCQGYFQGDAYSLPVPPSPNLPNMRAIYLYPSLCLFEGTVVSVGRGTEAPFQLYGAPGALPTGFQFVPSPMQGAKHPFQEGLTCNGYDLRAFPPDQIRRLGRLDLHYLIDFYRQIPDPADFFLPDHFFDKLAGTDQLRLQIQQGWREEEIRKSWEPGLQEFLAKRRPYLLYANAK